MNRERLEQLIDAYGASPHRWPESERAAALRLLDQAPDLERMRQAAAGLDHALDAAPRPRASMALHDRVLASAVQAARPRLFRFEILRPFAWLTAAGLMAATGAGAVSGLAMTTHLTADARAEAVYTQADFAVIDDAEVLG